jgi:zinc/manganese transport system substrate-binding protein
VSAAGRMNGVRRAGRGVRAGRGRFGGFGRSDRSGRLLGLLAVAILSLGVWGCSSATSSPDGKIVAVAGENFYGDLIGRLGGERVRVTSIISDPAVDPHSYETSPQNAETVADASLVVENGLGYDTFLDRLLGASSRSGRKVIDVQQLLGVPDGSNPHLWYDPPTMPRVARAVADALGQIEPASKSLFEANLNAYLDSFAPLTSLIADMKARFAGTAVAYTESVPGYLLTALAFEAITPPGFARAVENGTDPAPIDVADMQDLLSGRKVRMLLYNSQATSPVTQSIKAMAEQVGVPVVGVSETIPKQNQSYVDWQLAQLDDMATALGGNA